MSFLIINAPLLALLRIGWKKGQKKRGNQEIMLLWQMNAFVRDLASDCTLFLSCFGHPGQFLAKNKGELARLPAEACAQTRSFAS